VSSPLLIHFVTIKTISGVALPIRCPFATARLATDEKLRISQMHLKSMESPTTWLHVPLPPMLPVTLIFVAVND
ncbi:hypothetical protein HID58_002704, partial [Brassica napus]